MEMMLLEERLSGKCWVNNHAHVLKPKESIDVDYLYYSLMFYRVDGMVNGGNADKAYSSSNAKNAHSIKKY